MQKDAQGELSTYVTCRTTKMRADTKQLAKLKNINYKITTSMEKTKKLFSKKWRALAAIFFLAAFATSVQAQDVTIRANNGACVAAVKDGGVNDTFFNVGGFATWQHEQLNMVLTTSDGTALTPNGQLDNPANNLFMAADGVHMQMAHGQVDNANVCYATVSLPSGYRFTGYEIKFSKPGNLNKGRYNNQNVILNSTNANSTFGETNNTFGTYVTQATISTNGTAQTISREESAAQPMGNVLYFKLQNPTNSRTAIQFEEARFYFTAEDNFSPVTPASEISTPVSAVKVPYPTSKVDFGTIKNNEYNGAYRISYESANVNDINANFLLYEAESTTTGEDIDDISGQVVDFKSGSQYTITSAGGYFKLGKGASSTEEQVYFIETPTTVEISDGHEVPIGYRITGVEFDYATNVTASRTFYVTYTTTGWFGTTYYLGTNGRFGSTQTQWEMDGEGYISSGSGNNKRYLVFNNGTAGTQTQKPEPSERFGIDENNNIYQLQWPTYFVTYYAQGNTRYCYISNTTGEKATYQQINTSSASVGNFTLKVYDKTGANPETINVTGNGTKKLTGLNNDAVKFGVIGQGLVRATLTMQALDPYIDQMAVVCQDREEPAIKLTQYFHASDFSVSGGEFDFYLPSDCAERGDHVDITFEDLQSKYFDETYTTYNAETGPHFSRLNFVRSAHYDAFGTTTNVIYNNPTEAASATPLERQKVSIVGSAPFKFNNAGDVESTPTGGSTNIEEYAFSLANYAAAPNNGTFGTMWFQVKATTQTDTRYVFTTDETRYNIAPTTATQHRAYAFYTMKVNIHSTTYEPRIKFTKIYNQTLYGTGQTDAFYGAEISTTAPASVGAGYAATDKVHERMEQLIKDGTDDFGNEAPASAKQILYIDFSKLDGVYQTTTEEHESMEDYSATNAANCLMFVPQGAGATVPNVAEKSTAGFRATYNFVLTDKEPFYSPYDIQVPSGRTLTYKRLVTTDKYGKVNNASIILPFAIALDESGKHTNADGTSFTLHTMQSSKALRVDDDKVVAFFPPVSGVSEAAANTPYLVKIDGQSSEANVTFTISQPGAPISKTAGVMANDYTIAGAASTGVTAGAGEGQGTWTFTPKGTYAGQKVAKGENIFYFGNNIFNSSKDLSDNYADVKIAPFRVYYATSVSGNAKLNSFTPVFEEGEGDVITAIAPVSAIIDVNAPVYDLQGRMVATSYSSLNGKKLAAGMYVVNGVKFIVK